MPVIVQKYGGSSVADIHKLGQVADKVVAAKRAGHDVVVTVSAMGKTTDNLLTLAKDAGRVGDAEPEPPRRELDMLVSTGERVSMSLLAIAIAARGESAISFTGSQSGIITSDRHFDARIIEVRPHRIEDELARGKIVIVAGYQGMSYKREITTLGRGGSDTTAVALAAAFGAVRCEIYSDVDGVYSADPRVVPNAEHLPTVDPAVLQEMAEAGAKVLNAQAVEWARKSRITIVARKTQDDWSNGQGRETRISEDDAKVPVRAIVSEGNLVQGRTSMASFAKVVETAEREQIPLKDVHATGGSATFVVPLLNVPDWPRAEARLREANLGVELSGRRACISVVGDSLSTTAAPLAAFLAVVGSAHSSVTATALRMSALVDEERTGDLSRALHHRFVETN